MKTVSTLLALALALACACSPEDPDRGIVVVDHNGALDGYQPPEPVTPPVPPEPEPDRSTSDVQRPTPNHSELEPEPEPEHEPEPEPDPEPVPDAVTATIHRGVTTAETDGYRVVFPTRREALEITWTPIPTTALEEPRPLSVVLAAAELAPRYEVFTERIEITMPLRGDLEPGTRVWMLGYSRSMQAFGVSAEARVSEDGTATFSTDLATQYAVIAAPEVAETACSDVPMAIDQAGPPGAHEEEITGQVPVNQRMSREVAFQVLSDMRAFDGASVIHFKNEEDRPDETGSNTGYEDEDYLVDPRLAAPLIRLGGLVLEQWTDPVGGGPAFQLRVTDAYDSVIEHSETSNHYRGRAIDLTLSPIPPAHREARADAYGRLSTLAYCSGFDFVHFENRYHVHVSSRPARIARVDERSDGRSIVMTDVDGGRPRVLSAEAGLPLEDTDVRRLRFPPTGRRLAVYGRIKGEPTAAWINLARRTWSHLQPNRPMPDPEDVVTIDPSLQLVITEDGRLLLQRPGDGPTEGFQLTSEGVRGRVPTVWTNPWPGL
jgi:hypothetical protein